MAPPDTNIEKQARRHIGPLVGMAVVIVAVGVAAVVLFGPSEPAEPDPPEEQGQAPTPAED